MRRAVRGAIYATTLHTQSTRYRTEYIDEYMRHLHSVGVRFPDVRLLLAFYGT
jgi:hypothetical protein